MANREEGAAVPKGKGKNNLITRMQLDKGTYILTGQISNQNFQENRKMMQRHICYDQMTRWKLIALMKDIRVQRFCLKLLGEARLWYQSLEPLGDTTWAQLQNLFRQRYSKLGNTREQLFHAWRSFTFDKNTETTDSYVIRIRQVATLLGYGEPQILEVFKNTLPTKLYWVLFPIEDLRQAVETAKRILTKEKLDRQLTGQTSTSPFMNIRDGTDKRVSFSARDEL